MAVKTDSVKGSRICLSKNQYGGDTMSPEGKSQKAITRRNFVIGAAGAGAAVTGLGSLLRAETTPGGASMGSEAAQMKYDKYFAKNVAKKNQWGGEGIGLTAAEGVIPPDARMNLGITIVRKPYMFHEPTHKHMFTEYFFFFGSNPMDMNEFDADVEFTFGAEREKHVISSPTIVTIPPGVYHCPLNYARVGKPFYCLEAFLTSKYDGIDLGKDPNEIRVPEPNYNRFFTKGVVRDNQWGGEGIGLSTVPDYLIPAGARMNLGVTVVRKPYMFHEPTHKHNFTEFFFFFGSNPMDMTEFDAEAEYSFGAEREKHVIAGPTVVTIPGGVYHCPMNFAKIRKPIYCLEAFLTSKYEGTDL
jgi:uncharacterized RmlC-like cupin family protein